VAGLFAVGEQPTGSKDPFGLRRAAQGAVKIVAEADWELDLEAVVARAAEAVAPIADADPREVTASVSAFLLDRVRRYLVDVVGVAGDTADAVLAAGWSNVPTAVRRARALQTARATERFRMLSLAFKRVRNITDGQPDASVDDVLFEHDAERRLHDDAKRFHDRLDGFLADGRVDEAFAAMEPLAESLDRFFVDVLVMVEDDRIRVNRIALLKFLGRDFLRLADLSKLQIEGGD
jgi:glycyl-tRNA synthetase beta chain